MTAKTTAERQEALRSKREMLGLLEVRGIYLPKQLHPELKKLAERLAKRKPKENK